MRARNIKPGFFKNEDLLECDPLERILFIGLWCLADREGRLEDRPKRIKIEILPCDNCDMDFMLNRLASFGFILRYSLGGAKYIQVLNFHKHQHPHHREPASSIPAPHATTVHDTKAPGQPQASPGPALGQPQYSPSDSLIPDSLIHKKPNVSSTRCQAEPDAAPPPPCVPESKTEVVELHSNGSPPYAEIIGHLNHCSGSTFKHDTPSTQALIKARYRQGFTFDDFMTVISYKCEKWKTDPEMAPFMRPKTLFSDKFESYLNEAKRAPPGAQRFSKVTARSIANTANWRPPDD
jgi:uncharacterized phage protein (TIGR02220 family)